MIGVQEGLEVGADIWSISINNKNKWGLEIVDDYRKLLKVRLLDVKYMCIRNW